MLEITVTFEDKTKMPTEDELSNILGDAYDLWNEIKNYTFSKDSKLTDEWKYPGKKYGWSYRIKAQKRIIIYFIAQVNYFLVAFSFGNKAYNFILQSDISVHIKNELSNAKEYMEGRGIRIPIHKKEDLIDIFKLIEIKLSF